MENASKALIMVASILIGVMIIAFMVYMFSDGSKLNKSHDISVVEKEIKAFNADFQTYESLTELIVDPATNYLYKTQYARFNALKSLNVISDVITAVNSAFDVNYQNSNKYKVDDYVEYENGLVIVIDLKKNNLIPNFAGPGKASKTKYVIFPNKDIEYGYVYGMNDSEYTSLMTKIKNHDKNISISSYQKVPISAFLENFRESRVATSADSPPDSSYYTLYKYYFVGELNINSETGKVDKVVFSLVTDKEF